MRNIPQYILELALIFDIQNSACGGITIGAAFDCDDPITPGVDQRLILVNKEDISAVTYDVTLTSLITGITLTALKTGFAFQGVRQALNPQYTFVPQTVSVGYDHQVDFMVFDISQAQKDNLEKMAMTKMVAIIENRNTTGNSNSVFEVYGLEVGLDMQTNVRIPADNETAGAFSISLMTSPNGGKEPKMPQSWWLTNYATTKALVDALLT